MSRSNENTPTVGTEYSAQNPTTTETIPTIYARAPNTDHLWIKDVQVHRVTAKRIVVILRLHNVDELYWPIYTLDRTDLETGKPCSRKFAHRIAERGARECDPLEIRTSRHVIEFSFSEEMASAVSSMGRDLDASINKIFFSRFVYTQYFLQQLVVLGAQIPADHRFRLYVEDVASIMDSIPVPEMIPKVD